MKKDSGIMQDLKYENRNNIYNTIRRKGCISGPSLMYELHLSRPTVTQNINVLLEEGLICEKGFVGNTGGRRAKGYSIVEDYKVAVGLDITKHHLTVIVVNLYGAIIYEKRMRYNFILNDEYRMKMGEVIQEALAEAALKSQQVLGVGIALPGLITADYKRIFCGKILDVEGATADEFGKYIPFPCRLYNDADAGGYAEITQNGKLKDAFYISLSNNVGGAVLIDHKVYRGEGQRSGEVGHMTLYPDGKKCYCGRRGCVETYCNARLLSDITDGDLSEFFRRLENNNKECKKAWEEYLKNLVIAVNNTRMLFDCKIILGGYVGAYLDDYIGQIRHMAKDRNSFENNANYLQACTVKKEALAFGAALPFVHEFWKKI